MVRNGIPSFFFFHGMVRNGIPRVLRSAKWKKFRRNKTLILCLFRVSLESLYLVIMFNIIHLQDGNTNVKFMLRM
jgi:hypothetical protein